MAKSKMPADPKKAHVWKLEGVRAWAEAQKCMPLVLDHAVGELEDAKEVTPDPYGVVGDRYLVVNLVYYRTDDPNDTELDDEDYTTCDTLDEVTDAVEDFLFADIDADLAHVCAVFDTHTRTEIEFEVVQTIRFVKPKPRK